MYDLGETPSIAEMPWFRQLRQPMRRPIRQPMRRPRPAIKRPDIRAAQCQQYLRQGISGLNEWRPASPAQVREEMRALTRGSFAKELFDTTPNEEMDEFSGLGAIVAQDSFYELEGLGVTIHPKDIETEVYKALLAGLQKGDVCPLTQQEFDEHLAGFWKKLKKKAKKAVKKVVKTVKRSPSKVLKASRKLVKTVSKPKRILKAVKTFAVRYNPMTAPARILSKAVVKTALPSATASRITRQIDNVSDKVTKAMIIGSTAAVAAAAVAAGAPALSQGVTALTGSTTGLMQSAIDKLKNTIPGGEKISDMFSSSLTNIAKDRAKDYLKDQGINIASSAADDLLTRTVQDQQMKIGAQIGQTPPPEQSGTGIPWPAIAIPGAAIAAMLFTR